MDPNGVCLNKLSDDNMSNRSIEMLKMDANLNKKETKENGAILVPKYDLICRNKKFKNCNMGIKDISAENDSNIMDNISMKSKRKRMNNSKDEMKDIVKKKKCEEGSETKIFSIHTTNASTILNTSFSGKQCDEIKEAQEKQIKLLKNRMSAKKCRQKKKNYIMQLESQVRMFQEQLGQYKSEICKEQSIENETKLLLEKEKEIEYSSNKKSSIISKAMYTKNQKKIISNIFLLQIQLMMPLECRLFQKKFIKLAQFEKGDSIEELLIKINQNLQMLNELYEFKKKQMFQTTKGIDSTAFKLYIFYENLKKYTEIFIANLNSME